jgi:Na+-transporting methylmalonyl-CoA/oxaloacetate decarboxylase gamma subunit
MKTQYFIESKSPSTDEFDALCEKILSHEVKIQFFEKIFSELLQEFKINSSTQTFQQISQADLNTLHILGFNFQNVRQLPSIGLIVFGLCNLFSFLLILTHLLLFQTASHWVNLIPAYIECSVFFLICVSSGLMFRATRVTRRIDEILSSIFSMIGLALAFGSAQRLFFYAEHLTPFSLHKNFIPTQIFHLYTQIPTSMWAQFLLIMLCVLGVMVFYVSSYLCSASPEISNIIRRYPALFDVKHSHEVQNTKRNLIQEIHKAKNNLRAFERLKTKLIAEFLEDPVFAHLHLSISDDDIDPIQQFQEQVTYLAIDHLNLEQQHQLERIQHLLSNIQLLSQDASSLQQQFEIFNTVQAERI